MEVLERYWFVCRKQIGNETDIKHIGWELQKLIPDRLIVDIDKYRKKISGELVKKQIGEKYQWIWVN